jgi:hypothetical protein
LIGAWLVGHRSAERNVAGTERHFDLDQGDEKHFSVTAYVFGDNDGDLAISAIADERLIDPILLAKDLEPL